MNYHEALHFLNSLVNFEMDRQKKYERMNYNIERMKELSWLMGNPESKMKIFHVAGTNGKGSVSTMFYTLLINNHVPAGLYISPHVRDIKERIQANGKIISEKDFAHAVEKVREAAAKMEDHPTYFEALTAAAMFYFDKAGCHWACLETGLGGRLDSTNAYNTDITCITSISLDHTDKLGSTIEEIAAEKAGIIKSNTPLIVGNMEDSAMQVINGKAKTQNAEVSVFGRDFNAGQNTVFAKDHTFFNFMPGNYKLTVPVTGIKIPESASLAFFALKKFYPHALPDFTGLELPARMTLLHQNPDIFVDGAHNPGAAAILSQSLKAIYPDKKFHFFCAFLADKDHHSVIKEITGIAETITLTKIPHPSDNSAMAFSDTKKLFENVFFTEHPGTYLQQIKEENNPDNVYIICGSFYLAAEILKCFSEYFR